MAIFMGIGVGLLSEEVEKLKRQVQELQVEIKRCENRGLWEEVKIRETIIEELEVKIANLENEIEAKKQGYGDSDNHGVSDIPNYSGID